MPFDSVTNTVTCENCGAETPFYGEVSADGWIAFLGDGEMLKGRHDPNDACYLCPECADKVHQYTIWANGPPVSGKSESA